MAILEMVRNQQVVAHQETLESELIIELEELKVYQAEIMALLFVAGDQGITETDLANLLEIDKSAGLTKY